MFKLKVLFIGLLISGLMDNLYAQKYHVADFEETQVPKSDSAAWHKFIKHQLDFKVWLRHGKLKIGEFDTNRDLPHEAEVSVDRGRIVGTDEGEFYGMLTFEDDGGGVTQIKRGDFPFVFIYKDNIFFIDTTDPFRKGALYKLTYNDGKYAYEKILDFDEPPRTMCIVDGDILAGSFNYFYRIHDLQKEVIFKGFFSDETVSPTSIAATDLQHVYVGIDGGYVQFNLVTNTYKCFRYSKKYPWD